MPQQNTAIRDDGTPRHIRTHALKRLRPMSFGAWPVERTPAPIPLSSLPTSVGLRTRAPCCRQPGHLGRHLFLELL